MPDNAFRNAAVRTGPWLLQCSGQHRTRHATPRRWRSLRFSDRACGAHDMRLGHAQSSHPRDHPHAVAYDTADPGADGCARKAGDHAVRSARCLGRRLGGRCDPCSAAHRCPDAAHGGGSCLRNCAHRNAAQNSDQNRDQYLTQYQHQYPLLHCAYRQLCYLSHRSGCCADRNTPRRFPSSGPAHPQPGPVPRNAVDYGQHRAQGGALNMFQRGAVSCGANLGAYRGDHDRPHRESCRRRDQPGCITTHTAARAGLYIPARRHHGKAGYCRDRPGPSSEPGRRHGSVQREASYAGQCCAKGL
jgi:hypothetical protein